MLSLCLMYVILSITFDLESTVFGEIYFLLTIFMIYNIMESIMTILILKIWSRCDFSTFWIRWIEEDCSSIPSHVLYFSKLVLIYSIPFSFISYEQHKEKKYDYIYFCNTSTLHYFWFIRVRTSFLQSFFYWPINQVSD